MIIACLNFYNELPALKASVPTYYNKVDKIIAVDGAYRDYPADVPYSTDGSLEFLERLSKVKLIRTRTFWKDQCVKRSRYFSEGKKGDLFFIIDADEFIEEFPDMYSFDEDVGQVEFRSPLYKKSYTEPRIFRYRKGLKYQNRHHYVYDNSGLIATHREVGPGISSGNTEIKIIHRRGYGKSGEARAAKKEFKRIQNNIEDVDIVMADIQPLHIVMFTGYDPAGIAWGLNEAINTTTPHTVTYFRQNNNYIDYEEQHITSKHVSLARNHVRLSDIIHCHLSLNYADTLEINSDARYVIHHHGTEFRRDPEKMNKICERRKPVRIVSNLELTRYGKDLNYLENPVPFAKYNTMSRLYAGSKDGIFKIAHSPTSRGNKGTAIFLKAIENLKKKGCPVEAILIERKSHKEALEMKVKADACFDSFWLGMQVSGLESACFEQPVLAGDEFIRDRMIGLYGYCPYTFVTEDTLAEQIENLICYKQFYKQEQERVTAHVKKYHDYGPVAKKYLELIDREIKN